MKLQQGEPRRRMLVCVVSLAVMGARLVHGADGRASDQPAKAVEALRGGVAVVDITPPVPYRMSGYFSERLSTGIKDPLFAKAMYWEQGPVRAAIVVCDLIGIDAHVARAVRTQAAAETGIPIEHLAIAATHSHTGPLYAGAMRDHFHQQAVAAHGTDPAEIIDYRQELTQRLVEVIGTAQRSAVPMVIRSGVVEEPRLSFNRRFHMRDGSVVFNPGQQNPEIVRVAGPIDPEVGLIEMTGLADQQPIGLFTAFALHLDTVGGTEYSGDYPAVLQRQLRAQYGPDFLSIFGAGTCGDINHVDVSIRGRRSAEQIGTLLSETVLQALPRLAPVEPSLAVRSGTVAVPLQSYSSEEIAQARKDLAHVGDGAVPFLDRVRTNKIVEVSRRSASELPIEVQVFRLSRDTAVVTLPGEVFVELGLAIKQQSPFATTLVVELTNDKPAYLPTVKAFREGSYETVNSLIAPGGGEAMVDLAVRLLKELAP
jgi:neutral ceramidase